MASTNDLDALRTEFKAQIEKCLVQAICKRKYIQTGKLIAWMMEDGRLDRLLYLCELRDDDFTNDFLTATKIANGEHRCILLFSILLELEEGPLIHELRKYGYADSSLPIDLKTLEKLRAFEHMKDLPKRFNEAQWKYCPLKFLLEEDRVVPAELIIPICLREEIKEGGTAKVYQILVQEEFVNEALQAAVPSSRYNDKEYGLCYLFALKSYKDGNVALYENEKRAFRGLSRNQGMIKCLFNYSGVENEEIGTSSYNLVLEYGQYDLQDYVHSHLPPVLPIEQSAFWRDLFLVADAVKDIHVIKRETVNGYEKYYGWHADIKPENILNVEGEFKLADPGFARFEKQLDKRAEKDDTIYLGGTSTFGAPECNISGYPPTPGRSIAVKRAIDIWSLGCVFSYAATWVVYGTAGLDQFEELRQCAIRELVQNASASDGSNIKLGRSDCFHDGQNILPAVLEWHEFLRHGLRKNDNITEKVLSLVETHMLVGAPSSRMGAADLCQELLKIREAPCTPIAIAQSVQDALTRTEQIWTDKTEAAQRNNNVDSTRSIGSSHVYRLHSRQLTQDGPSSRLIPTNLRTSHRSKVASGGSSISMPMSRLLVPIGAHSTQVRVIEQAPWQLLRNERETPLATPTAELTKSSGIQSSSDRSTPATPRQSGAPTPITSQSHHRSFSGLVSSLKSRTRRQKGDPELKRYLDGRDLVFIMDNGASMAPYWEAAKDLLLELVTKAKNVDEDGMELLFTATDTKFKASNKPEAFRKEVSLPHHLPIATKDTNMGITLNEVLEAYLDSFDLRKNRMLKKTLIILTDGKWNAMKNNLNVDNAIVRFSQRLREKRPNVLEDESRRVSIQFVQFGDDMSARARLRRLDTQLKYKGVPDIVDHRTPDAGLFKILTGSVYESDDESEKETEATKAEARESGFGSTVFQSPDALSGSEHSPVENSLSPIMSPMSPLPGVMENGHGVQQNALALGSPHKAPDFAFSEH